MEHKLKPDAGDSTFEHAWFSREQVLKTTTGKVDKFLQFQDSRGGFPVVLSVHPIWTHEVVSKNSGTQPDWLSTAQTFRSRK